MRGRVGGSFDQGIQQHMNQGGKIPQLGGKPAWASIGGQEFSRAAKLPPLEGERPFRSMDGPDMGMAFALAQAQANQGAQLEPLNLKLNQQDAALGHQSHKQAAMEERLGFLEQKLNSAERMSSEVSRAFDVQNQRVGAMGTDLTRATSELTDLKMRYEGAMASNGQLQNQVMAMTAELRNHDAKFGQLAAQMGDSLRMNSELRGQIGMMGDELQRASADRANANRAMDGLARQFQEGTTMLAEEGRRAVDEANATLRAERQRRQQQHLSDLSILNREVDAYRQEVAIVTAAGYPGEAHKFEKRLEGLLQAFRDQKLPAEVTDKFHIMGGECNYLLRVTPVEKTLEFVPEDEWKTEEMMAWKEEDILEMLNEARLLLEDGAQRLKLPVDYIQKGRAVGIVPQTHTIYEVLEDIALTVQTQLEAKIPFCAFNGGNDVFVDVGNKSLGLHALMRYLGTQPNETMHVGDRFTLSGNDAATRDVCSVLWVANPEETGFFLKMLLKDVRKVKEQRYIE